jgi:hypothetical protein
MSIPRPFNTVAVMRHYKEPILFKCETITSKIFESVYRMFQNISGQVGRL